jgi:hypothetical protein
MRAGHVSMPILMPAPAVTQSDAVPILETWSPVRPCWWDSSGFSTADNTCYKRCGAPYTPEDSPGADRNWLFCCPKGYSVKLAENHDPNAATCVKN